MRRSRGPAPQRFLRPRRGKKPRWEFLDRPVTLTLFGTFGVGLLTLYWQTSEARRATEQTYQRALLDQRFELVRTLTKTYQKSANILTAKIVKTLAIAERRNALGAAIDDPENETKKKVIDDIVRDVKELDDLKNALLAAIRDEITAARNRDVRRRPERVPSSAGR